MSYKITTLYMKKVRISEWEGLSGRRLVVLSLEIGTLVWVAEVYMGV